MDTKLLVLNKFYNKVKQIDEKISMMKSFAYSLPDFNKTKQKYIETIESLELPSNPVILDDQLIFQIYGEQKAVIFKNIHSIGFCKDLKVRATITNLIALMNGTKQKAVNETAKARRLPDGTYRGISKTMMVRKEQNLNELIAQKVAIARRMSDGSFKGIEKTLKTKKDKNINKAAAYKTAAARRMPDGSFKGAYKTAQTRRQRGYASTKYGAPCVYQHKEGYWIVMRSMWEWAYAYWLDSQNIRWRYESTNLVVNGKSHIPDFTINDCEYHEIKPEKMVDEKLDKNYISKYNIKVITEKDFNFKQYRAQAERYRIDGSDSFRKNFRLQGSLRYLHARYPQLYSKQ